MAAKVWIKLNLRPLPNLRLDKNEIRQMLLHMVRNSIEAMVSGGNLEIQTLRGNDTVILSISDRVPALTITSLISSERRLLRLKIPAQGLEFPYAKITYEEALRMLEYQNERL